ncbi:MAG: acyl-CoA carboxylase subunit epsilon [Sciscionella sp.]
MTEESEQPRRPLLRVVRGNPDDAEIAALSAIVAGLGSAAVEPEEPRQRSLWADRSVWHGRMPQPGPGAWRASWLPR